MSTMQQSILVAPKTSEVQERPLPIPKENEVLIKVKLCGICASEVYPWLHANAEREFGHEVVGEVTEVGQAVKKLRAGMRVTGLIYKGFAEYAVAPESQVVPVPDSLADEAALGEPLACVVSGIRRTAIDLGDKVALVGLGYMGLLSLQVAKLKGPSELIAVDTRNEALKRALRFGADLAIKPDEVNDALRLETWQDIPKKTGVDVAIEAAGNPHALDLASCMVKAHGVLSIVGYHQGESTQVNMQMWNWKALDVLNAHERRSGYLINCMTRGLRLLERGKLDGASLVTHEFSLDEVDRAYSAIVDKPAGFIKSVVRLSE